MSSPNVQKPLWIPSRDSSENWSVLFRFTTSFLELMYSWPPIRNIFFWFLFHISNSATFRLCLALSGEEGIYGLSSSVSPASRGQSKSTISPWFTLAILFHSSSNTPLASADLSVLFLKHRVTDKVSFWSRGGSGDPGNLVNIVCPYQGNDIHTNIQSTAITRMFQNQNQ